MKTRAVINGTKSPTTTLETGNMPAARFTDKSVTLFGGGEEVDVEGLIRLYERVIMPMILICDSALAFENVLEMVEVEDANVMGELCEAVLPDVLDTSLDEV